MSGTSVSKSSAVLCCSSSHFLFIVDAFIKQRYKAIMQKALFSTKRDNLGRKFHTFFVPRKRLSPEICVLTPRGGILNFWHVFSLKISVGIHFPKMDDLTKYSLF